MTIKILIPEPIDGIDRLDQWSEKQGEIKRRFLDKIGQGNVPRNILDIETIETTECGSYMRYKLRYWVGEKEEVRAYLIVLNGLKAPALAILAMHQMNKYGKDEVAGLYGNKDLHTVLN